MYAVVEFTDYRKDNRFEVVAFTEDVEYAKKLTFKSANKDLSRQRNNEKTFFKITKIQDYEYEYLHPVNKIIVAYKIIELEKCKKGVKIVSCNTNVYAVVELDKTDITENLDEIDSSLVCENYYSYDHDDDDDENQ
jgi:hypothetical protein